MFKWIRNWFRGKSRKRMDAQQLTDITRGMHHAASTTAAMIAQQYIRIIEQFFDTKEDGTMSAKMIRVEIDEKHHVFIPLISLVSPKGLALEKMRVEMSVKIEETQLKKATDQADNSNATRTGFKVSLSPKSSVLGRRSDIIDIEMIFTSGDPPEGMMRIIDQYTDMIKPVPNNGNGGNGGNGNGSTKWHTIGYPTPNTGDGGQFTEKYSPGATEALEPISDDGENDTKDETKILSEEDLKPEVDQNGEPKTPEGSEPTDE